MGFLVFVDFFHWKKIVINSSSIIADIDKLEDSPTRKYTHTYNYINHIHWKRRKQNKNPDHNKREHAHIDSLTMASERDYEEQEKESRLAEKQPFVFFN